MKYIGIPQSVCEKYWLLPFSELVVIAEEKIDGVCDAEALDLQIWERSKSEGAVYDGVRSWGGRKRMAGFAIMYQGDQQFGRDVAALLIQNF